VALGKLPPWGWLALLSRRDRVALGKLPPWGWLALLSRRDRVALGKLPPGESWPDHKGERKPGNSETAGTPGTPPENAKATRLPGTAGAIVQALRREAGRPGLLALSSRRDRMALS
jgi:hypothetical protein